MEGVDVVGLAVNGEEAVELTMRLQPDVVVIADDQQTVRTALAESLRACPIEEMSERIRVLIIVSGPSTARIVGLSVYEDDVGDEICDAGAVTFIPKLCEASVLADAVRFAAESPPNKPR